MIRLIKLVLALQGRCGLVVGLLVVGCSVGPGDPSPPALVQAEAAPFHLEILREVNDGTKLYVQGRISSQQQRSLSDVALCTTGHNYGDMLQRRCQPLGELLLIPPGDEADAPQEISPGQALPFMVTLPVAAATDYQLDLIWGREAETWQPDSDAALAVPIEGFAIERRLRCGPGGCEIFFTLVGELVNLTAEPLRQVVLAVALVWVPEGTAGPAGSMERPGEEELEVAELQLAPGARQSFRLDLDRPVPESPGGEWQPVLRVKSWF